MAYPTREAVYTALFTQLSGLTGFTTWQRNVILPIDVTKEKSPYLILMEGNAHDTYDAHRLLKRELDAFIVIYFRKTDRTVPGSTIINPLLDTVYDALAPTDLLRNELVLTDSNGNILASWVRVEGQTVVENGDTDPEGLGGALIPLKMLLP